MKKFTFKLLFGFMFLATTGIYSQKTRPNMLFSAQLDGAQETPSVSGSGSGVASFMLNATRDTLCVNVTFSGLSGTPTGAHIHTGATGVAGPITIDLTSYISGNSLVGTITGTALTTTLKSNMLKGMTYINIHTAANAGGEIRGQIWLESDWAFTGAMNGAQETPSVSTAGNGYAVFNLAKHQGTIKFYLVTNGLSGTITGAHLHAGAIGVGGPIIQDLTSYINGNVLSGAFTPSPNVIAGLMSGTVYVNVHTAANPGGEIRAQLRMDDKIAFDGWMNGAQETPSVSTTAMGLTSLKLNTMMDTLWYNVYTTGLSGSITASHIHTGAVGVAGPVAVAFGTPTLNMLSGIITGTALTNTLINNLLSGGCYANAHTTLNPGGEIRGQLWRVMREGYTISMDGNQETPATTSTATGSGIVSINRDWDNAHYLIGSNGITPSGMHFHKAIVGVAGGIINDILSTYTNNMASGYWKTTDATPFSTMIANEIDNDSVYVNMHTTANPGGEIRGQVLSGFRCYSMITGIKESADLSENEIVLAPNPAKNNATIFIQSGSNENISVIIYDVVGKSIQNITSQVNTGQNKINMDLTNIKSGIYFVKISNAKGDVVKKIIIE